MQRREFLLAGGTMVGAAAVGSYALPRKALAKIPLLRNWSGLSVDLAELDSAHAGVLGDASPSAIFSALASPLRFTTLSKLAAQTDGKRPAMIASAARVRVLAASIGAQARIESLKVEIEFPGAAPASEPRLFTAMIAQADEAAISGVSCVVPINHSSGKTTGINLRLSIYTPNMAEGDQPVVHKVQLPSRSGVFAIGLGASGLKSGQLRIDDKGLGSDWPSCVLVSVG